MSMHAVPPSSGHDAGSLVAAAVAAARRRARLVLALGAGSITVPAGAATGAVLALAGLVPGWTAAALAAAGAATAMGWAAIRTPSTAVTASRIDAALGLRDRVAAALHLRGSDAPIAALVTRDAAARLEGVQLATVFPVALPRPAAPAIALAAGLCGWLAVANDVPVAPTANGVTPRAGSADSAATSRRQPAARTGDTQDAKEETARRPDTARDERTPERRASQDGTGPGEPASGRSALDEPSNAPRPAATTPPQSDADRNASASSNGGSGGTAGTTPSGLGSSTQTASRDTQGAGGVSRRGALAPSGAPSDTAALPSRDYRAARANAEAAITRDVVPPDYRDDVRAYFRALASGGSQ